MYKGPSSPKHKNAKNSENKVLLAYKDEGDSDYVKIAKQMKRNGSFVVKMKVHKRNESNMLPILENWM